MREILFRGKRVDNGEWVYDGYFTDGKKHFIIIEVRYIPNTRDWDTVEYYEKNPKHTKTFIAVIPETVGQFTSLTDKNGKKIFEGDIVKGTFLGFLIPIKNFVFDIGWHQNVAGYKANYFDNVEVIGNIHDNPELLKGGG